jgi:hypothetical protein
VISEFSPLQEQLLLKFFVEFREDGFFLSGGSALSWGYLHHRLSEDLDFFCRAELDLAAVETRWLACLHQSGFRGEITRAGPTFRRFSISNGVETTIVDLVTGDPPGVDSLLLLGEIPVDSLLDLAVNKVTALNREEIKDFVDLYLIFETFGLNIFELLERAKVKTADADSDWFALEIAELLTHARRLPHFDRLFLLRPVDREAMIVRLADEGRKVYRFYQP